MNFLLIVSKEDIASINFEKQLFSYSFKNISKDLYILDIDTKNKVYLTVTNDLHIYLKEEDIVPNELKDINQVIFLTKHSTLNVNKPKCMTVHAIGNWGRAELGGKDNTVVETDPILIRKLLIELKRNKPKEIKEYEVKQEATHHGPYLEIPTIFFEIGSQESDWSNEVVSSYMIKVLLDVIKDYNKEEIKKKKGWIEAVGVGGSHYCSKFNKKTYKDSNLYAFGHVVANYALEDIENKPKLLEQAKQKSNSKVIIKEKDL